VKYEFRLLCLCALQDKFLQALMTGNLLPPPHVLPFAAAAALSAAANGSIHYPAGMPYPMFAAAAAAAAAGGMGPPGQHHLPPPPSNMVQSPSQHQHRPPAVVIPQGIPTSAASGGLGAFQHGRPLLVDGAVSPAAMGLVNGGTGAMGGQMVSPYSTPGSAAMAPDCYGSPEGQCIVHYGTSKCDSNH